jgi:peptidyl-prolyl cis-trans isomerase A (cyclophilin A)
LDARLENVPTMKTIALFCALGLFAAVTAVKAADATTNAAPAKAAKASDTVTNTVTAAAKTMPAITDPAKLTEKAPDTFKVQFDTTKGKFIVEVTRSLSPNGADRFYNLVRSGYFKDIAFFRVVPNFMCQFGIHGDPAVSAKWNEANIADDPVKGSNTRGTITFATAGPNTRTTQLFINFRDNVSLDGQGFSPFGKVVSGMDVVDKLYSGYGDAPDFGGRGPNQGRIAAEGNAYLKKEFPELDYIKSATILPAESSKK